MSLPAGLAKGLSQRDIPSLNGLRAIAALLVVFYHAGFAWCPAGLGVLIFFVLSGFLITWLLLKEEGEYGKVSLKAFYIRRSLRIFPAFYVFWILQSGLMILGHSQYPVAQGLCSFFYVNNYYQAIFGDPGTGLSHTWSLGIEEQFYLLWPWTFILLRDNRRRARFLAGAIAAIWVYREILVFVAHRSEGYIYEAFETRIDHLLVGCLLAVLLRQGAYGRVWEGLCATRRVAWPLLGLLAGSTALANLYGATYRDAIGFVVDPLLAAALIVWSVAHSKEGFGTLLNWNWMRYLGTISYGVYLYHMIAVGRSQALLHSTAWWSIPVSLVVVVCLAGASHRFVERPFLRMKQRFAVERPVMSAGYSTPISG